MDHSEALGLLKGGEAGVREWNRRREAGEGIPDLSMADLRGAHLDGADLRGANLILANLGGARLGGARLGRAHLGGADLGGADLGGADLDGADFRGADLGGADLGGAHLRGANLGGAHLMMTDLEEAVCRGTIFANVDLSEVKGLDKIKHEGPSTIGTDTFFRSQGKLPEAFLRGCGVPDALIAYLPSLISSMSQIHFYSCFISYSSQDRDFTDCLYADLQAKGIRCWLDHEHLKIGDPIRSRIDEAIRRNDKLMLVLSAHSLASPWVEGEVETALERERRKKEIVLFPIRLDDAVMDTDMPWAAKIRRERQIGDFRRWKEHDAYQEAFARLLRDLEVEGLMAR